MSIVDAARVYAVAGTSFRHRGRNPERGLDCAGLVKLAYLDNGVDLPDFTHYGREPFNNGLETHVEKALGAAVLVAPIRESDLRHGDVIIFRFHVNPHHMAIVATVEYGGQPALNIIHADGMSKRVVEHRLTPDMVKRITHVHRRAV
jgi:NlpC/P60 family